MLKRLAIALVAFPAAMVLVTLAVTNRQVVRLSLDPFNADPLVSVNLPFYVYLILALVAGILLGGFAVWLNQGRFRRMARTNSFEARRWRAETDRLTRERDAAAAAQSKDLVSVHHRNAA